MGPTLAPPNPCDTTPSPVPISTTAAPAPTPAPTPGCDDKPAGWKSTAGSTCADYVSKAWCTSDGGYGSGWDKSTDGTFDDWAVNGVAATVACCGCGGGSTVTGRQACQGHSYDEATCEAVGCCRWNVLLGCRANDADAQCFSGNPCDTTVSPGGLAACMGGKKKKKKSKRATRVSQPSPEPVLLPVVEEQQELLPMVPPLLEPYPIMPMAAPTMVETVQMVPTATPTMVETAVPMMQPTMLESAVPMMQTSAPTAISAMPATAMQGIGGFGTQALPAMGGGGFGTQALPGIL